MNVQTLNDAIVITNLDQKEVNYDYNVNANEENLQFSVGMVHSVARINLVVEAYLKSGGTQLDPTAVDPIKWIKVVPNGMIPALDLSGFLAQEMMKGKWDGKSMIATNVGNDVSLKAIYSFDFRDYMGVFPLGLPEEAKDLYVNITKPAVSDLYSTPGDLDYSSADQCWLKITVQIVMDESCNGSIGYRRYFEESVGFDSKDADKRKKIKLSRHGFLDSILLFNPDSIPITDLEIVKDEVEFPVKSTLLTEQLKASLINQNFADGITNIDLVRPIDAESSDSLRLDLQVGSISAPQSLRIMKEYIHLDKNLIAGRV
jgi:hypothetical protein